MPNPSRPVLAITFAIALFELAAVAACGDGGSDPAGPDAGSVDVDASPSCQEATGHSDFAWIEEHILVPGCASFSACHQGGAPAGGLDLTADAAFGSLVGMAAQEEASGGMMLVTPGKPAQSYLLVALGAEPGTPPSRGPMPLNNPRLCQEKLDAISRWIEAGATAP